MPRVLEIGRACLFKRTWPDHVTWLCPTGRHLNPPLPVKIPAFETGEAVPCLKRELARGGFDLVVYIVNGVPMARPRRRNLLHWNIRPARPDDPERAVAADMIGAIGNVPLAVLDVHDAPQLDPGDLPLLDRCDAFFKRELPTDAEILFFRFVDRKRARAGIPEKMHPIPIALSPERIAFAPGRPLAKTSDIFFSGNIANSEVRRVGIEQLRALRREGIDVDIGERMPIEQYMERCAKARLVWSPEGYGKECFRHYEAALCGSVPVINRAPRILHRPLQDSEHCFYYDASEEHGLANAVRRGLAGPERLRAMSMAGQEWVKKYHTMEAVSRYVAVTVLGAAFPQLAAES